MPRFSLLSTLRDAADPILLVSGDGRVVWQNNALKKIVGDRPRRWELGEWFLDRSVREILGTTTPRSVKVDYRESPPLRKLETATVVDVGPGAPGKELFLVTLTPGRPASSSLDESSVEQFLATMAHDLKNPLSAVFGYTDTLLDSPLGDGISPSQRDILTRVRATATRCLELVRNAQHIAQLELRGVRHSPGVIDANISVRDVLEYTWRDERLCPTLFVELSPEPLRVKVERTELERAIVNLLSNALKYTPPTGRISIRTRTAGSDAVIEINNSEPLIPADEIPKLFEKFVRGSTSVGVAGSGLGLYIVKLIVQSAGGRISAMSKEGEGTTFTVTLPRSI